METINITIRNNHKYATIDESYKIRLTDSVLNDLEQRLDPNKVKEQGILASATGEDIATLIYDHGDLIKEVVVETEEELHFEVLSFEFSEETALEATQKDLTATELNMKRFAEERDICPYCDSYHIDCTGNDIETSTFFEYYSCEACYKTWTLRFTADKVFGEIEENNKLPEYYILSEFEDILITQNNKLTNFLKQKGYKDKDIEEILEA